jgi:hypothetical protein
MVVAIAYHPASAQDFTVNVRAGVNLTNVDFRSAAASETAAKMAPVVGGGVGWRVISRLSFEGDVLYSQRVTEFDSAAEDTLTYVEVPLLLRLRVLERPSWAVHATFGVVQAWLLKAEETIGGERFDIEPALRTRDLAGAVGVQLRVGRILGDVRYLYGVTDLFVADLFDARQRTLQLLVGYQIVR